MSFLLYRWVLPEEFLVPNHYPRIPNILKNSECFIACYLMRATFQLSTPHGVVWGWAPSMVPKLSPAMLSG